MLVRKTYRILYLYVFLSYCLVGVVLNFNIVTEIEKYDIIILILNIINYRINLFYKEVFFMIEKLNLGLLKINLMISTILIFSVYDNIFLSTGMIIIGMIDILILVLNIEQTEIIKFILVLILYSYIILTTIYIGIEKNFYTSIVYLIFGILILELSILEYKKIKKE